MLALGVLGIVLMMIIPIPPLALDFLIALNISLAVTILLVALVLRSPLEFSVFPSIHSITR